MKPGGAVDLEQERPAHEETVLDLYRRHGARLYGFALGFLGEPADAEDAVQEAFVRLELHLRANGRNAEIRAWLFAVVANLCRDTLRARRRRLDMPLERAAEPPRGAQALALRRVLGRLKPRDRELVLLRGGGLSYAEIAAAMGLHDGSVGKLLSRALERFAALHARESGKEGA